MVDPAKRAEMAAHSECEGRPRKGDGSWVGLGAAIVVGCAVVVGAAILAVVLGWF